jgi:hypothetical protein
MCEQMWTQRYIFFLLRFVTIQRLFNKSQTSQLTICCCCCEIGFVLKLKKRASCQIVQVPSNRQERVNNYCTILSTNILASTHFHKETINLKNCWSEWPSFLPTHEGKRSVFNGKIPRPNATWITTKYYRHQQHVVPDIPAAHQTQQHTSHLLDTSETTHAS